VKYFSSLPGDVMLSKTERLTESVIKSVLEILRMHPETEFSELQLEQGTREKIISKQLILERLRNNSKIHFDSVTGRYRFKPVYPIKDSEDLLRFIENRPSLLVDSDLLECYKSLDEDISKLLSNKRVRAVRQSDFDRTLKCQKPLLHPTEVPAARPTKCSLYAGDRCPSCASNRGVVLMKRFDAEIENIRVSDEIKEFWSDVKLPHISEIQRITQAPSQHLLTLNTSQILSNKAVRKVRGAAKRGSQSGQRFSWSEVQANRVSNVHILGLLEGEGK
jgi:hypothetical protein